MLQTLLTSPQFMQRSATSSTSKASPSSRTPVSEAPSKRRRVDPASPSSTPSTPRDALIDHNAISAALKAEQDLIASARARNARDGDETEWILNLKMAAPSGLVYKQSPTNEHTTSDDDETVDDVWATASSGRQTYGSYKRKARHSNSVKADEENDDDSTSDPSESETSPQQPEASESTKRDSTQLQPGSNRSLLNSATGLRALNDADMRKRKRGQGKLNQRRPRKTI